jgi:lycopene cyclase CruP
MGLAETFLGALPDNPLAGLRRADALWQAYREGRVPCPVVIRESLEPLGETEWDVVICGGTLGLLMGCALVQRGWRVALLERGILQGRDQEWNISRRELAVLVRLHLLSQEELEGAIASEYNPARIAFHGGTELWVRDVLNVGVSPRQLLEILKAKFLAAGGQLFEQTGFAAATVHPDGVAVQAGDGFKTRLLLDAMGHFSPISQQARGRQKPDAVCMVVGTCAQGFPQNETGDLFVSTTPMERQCQYFWEAFPARDGRTTYLFTYLDAHPSRPSLEQLFDEYFRLLPQYQGVALENWAIALWIFSLLSPKSPPVSVEPDSAHRRQQRRPVAPQLWRLWGYAASPAPAGRRHPSSFGDGSTPSLCASAAATLPAQPFRHLAVSTRHERPAPPDRAARPH